MIGPHQSHFKSMVPGVPPFEGGTDSRGRASGQIPVCYANAGVNPHLPRYATQTPHRQGKHLEVVLVDYPALDCLCQKHVNHKQLHQTAYAELQKIQQQDLFIAKELSGSEMSTDPSALPLCHALRPWREGICHAELLPWDWEHIDT